MFRATNSPILRSTFWVIRVYSFWYNALTLLPTGAMAAPVGSSFGALYQKLYVQSKSAPEDGRNCLPKHVGLNLKNQ